MANRLFDQPGVGPCTEPGAGVGVHSLSALGWDWAPKSWDVDHERGLRQP